jgi:hypothetical protein
VVGELLTNGLLEEISASGTLVWRRDEGKGPLALHISRRGLAAIRADEDGPLPKAEERQDSPRITP